MRKRVIFDNIVVYEPTQALLYNINTPEKKVNLYAPTNKCLSLLIEAKHDVIAQRVFFEKIWEDNGLVITANTFYQHIAMLRRAFEDVGINDEVIVTIPRRGLSLSEKISLSVESISETELSDDLPLKIAYPVPARGIKDKDYRSLKKLALYLALSFLVFGITFYATQQLSESLLIREGIFDKYKYIGDIQGCSVNIYTSLNTLNEVSKKMKESNIDCDTYNKIYYSRIPLLDRTSLIACSNSKNEAVKCISYFFIKSK